MQKINDKRMSPAKAQETTFGTIGEKAFLICVKFSSYYCTQQEKAQVRKQWEIVGRREAGKTDAQRHE